MKTPEFVSPGEQWRKISGFPDYRVSDHGRVATRIMRVRKPGKTKPWTVVKPHPIGKGYLFVSLRNPRTKEQRKFYVHELVLLAFVGPRPLGHEARHFPDRSRTNNRLENLSWGTRQQNSADKLVHGTASNGGASGTANGLSKLNPKKVRFIRQNCTKNVGKLSLQKLADLFGVTKPCIRYVVARKTWRHVR